MCFDKYAFCQYTYNVVVDVAVSVATATTVIADDNNFVWMLFSVNLSLVYILD